MAANEAKTLHASRNVRYAKAHPHPKRRPVHVSHRSHTGKRQPFHQTSYALIFFVILFTMGCLLFVRHTVVNGLTDSGDVQLSGIVPGPPPSVPATIDQPGENERFTSNTITLSGTCEHDYIVEIYRNATLAGSVVCTPMSTFTIMITLEAGENELVAKTRDIINQYGPDSVTTTIFYDVPIIPEDDDEPATGEVGEDQNPTAEPTITGTETGLVVSSKGYFRVDQATKRVTLQIRIREGQGPYSVLVRWGDGEQTTKTYAKQGTYELQHTYARPGQYRVIIEVQDVTNVKAVFQTVVIVDGVTSLNLTASGTLTQRCQLDATCIFQNQLVDGVNRIWPVFSVVSIMTLCFWIGERVAVHAIVKKSIH